VGIGEVFLDAAVLTWQGSRPVFEPLEMPILPRRTPATLVVRGRWAPGEGDASQVTAALVEAIRDLRQRSADVRALPVGVHLDLAPEGDLQDYGEGLALLAEALPASVDLSATVNRQWLSDPQVASLGGADYLVAMLYGQRPGEVEDPRAYDFREMEQGLRRLEEIGCPYLLGVVKVGTALRIDVSGVQVDWTTEGSLKSLATHPGMTLEHGFTLEGIDRQLYAFVADRPVRVGDWDLSKGEKIRAVATSVPHLQEMYRLLGVWDLPGMRGVVFFRHAAATERFGVPLEGLPGALGEGPSDPILNMQLDLLRTDSRRLVLEFVLRNESPHPTDLGGVESNRVQVVCRGGSFGRVRAGDFQRFDLLSPDPSGKLVRTVRYPSVLQLFVPMLDGGESVSSGPVEVLVHGGVTLELMVEADFLVPYGRRAEFGPEIWRPVPDAGTAAGR
jgi:hypothetical protein